MNKKTHTFYVDLICAKVLVFLCCLMLGALPALFGFRLSMDGWGVDFLTIFASIFLGLILYFSVGVLFLRLIIPGYLKKIRLGDTGHAGEVLIISIFCNLLMHAATLLSYGVYAWNIFLIVTSTVFFTYPMYYLTNTLWNMQPEIRRIDSGKYRINTRFFANIPRETNSPEDYLPITISIPVYTESNEVIFQTIRSCLSAIRQFRERTGRAANLLISEDGLAKMLGGSVTAAALENPTAQAAERIAFYRANGIAFVARPVSGRKGKFKKGSNLNYTYDLARRMAAGENPQTLFAADGDFAGGYAEGVIAVHDLILMLDKDSGIVPGILEATAPEFSADPLLAYTQHATASANENLNYFTRVMSRFNDILFKIALPNKSLQGLQVPLMGHNAFIRKDFLEKSGGWAEDRVSEDFSKAIDAYAMGYHGKYIAYPGLDFTEYVCQHFVEETEKQSRYSYGVSELLFGGQSSAAKKRKALKNPNDPKPLKDSGRITVAHVMDMLIYYFSYFNLGAAVPTMLLLLFTHQIYYLFAGILINFVIFWFCPSVQVKLLGRSSGFSGLFSAFGNFALIGFTFFGHGYSMLRGLFVYLNDRIRRRYEPFGATNVETVERSFKLGMRILYAYYRKNLPGLATAVLIFYGCLMVLGDIPPHIIRPLIVAFLMTYVLAPVFLTPQIFSRSSKQKRRSSERK
jgi:cellulose synthase/poly-beta-1,6-N-acetylglucosamine synthase-like glycosyltransferase